MNKWIETGKDGGRHASRGPNRYPWDDWVAVDGKLQSRKWKGNPYLDGNDNPKGLCEAILGFKLF